MLHGWCKPSSYAVFFSTSSFETVSAYQKTTERKYKEGVTKCFWLSLFYYKLYTLNYPLSQNAFIALTA